MSLPKPSPDARAVVTGASSGIGEALATELATRGHSLIVVARRGELLEALAAKLTADHGVTVEVRASDLSNREQRQELVTELSEREISILCNNAGIATFGPVAGLDPAYERDQVELNAVAVHDLTLAVMPGMIGRGAGGILITGSAAGNMAIPNNATYAATKAFVNTFSESLRGELAGTGVNVTDWDYHAVGTVNELLRSTASRRQDRQAGCQGLGASDTEGLSMGSQSKGVSPGELLSDTVPRLGTQ